MQVTEPSPRATADDGRPCAETLNHAFARYQDELLGTLFYLVGNLEDARDALQEAFVKCWRHRDDLSAIENLKAWIFRVAMNTGRDLRSAAWRRRRQPLSGDVSMLATHEAGPTAILEQQENLSRLRQAILQLRAEEQEVFLLRQNGELTYDNIADLLGIPVSTVKTRMRLALEKLRLAMAPT